MMDEISPENCFSGPTFFVQSDWNEVLSKIAGEAWVSYKFKDENSKHGSLIRINGHGESATALINATDGFTATLLTHNAIRIGHVDTEYSCIFVAPRAIYEEIHKKGVTCLDVSTDNVCISVSSEDGKNISVWDPYTQTPLRTLSQHLGDVYRCRWFPSGKVILSCGADFQIRIWCSETGRSPVSLKGHTMAVTDIAIIDKGRNILSVSKDGYCKLWCCGTGLCIADVHKVNAPINCCSVNVASEKLTLPPAVKLDKDEFGTENKLVLLGDECGGCHIVAVASRSLMRKLHLDVPVNCSAPLADGAFAIGLDNGDVYEIEMSPRLQMRVWRETNSAAECVSAYGTDGFFSGHRDGSCVYRRNGSRVRLALTGSPAGDPVYAVATNGGEVYTACRDSAVRKYVPDPYIDRHIGAE